MLRLGITFGRFRIRRSGLVIRSRALGFLVCLLFLARLRCPAKLQFHKVLPDGDRVFFIGQELLDGACFGGIDGHIDLRVESVSSAK